MTPAYGVGDAGLMNRVNQRMMALWMGYGTKVLPFADVATPDLPLGRLLRLSLIQVSVGMALVLLVGTLNRVMIVELKVSAALVGVMIALPLLFAPFRALIGFRSDTHQSELGWRRVPFIWRGTMIQFGGLAIMPFALIVLSGANAAAHAPAWIGPSAAALAFLLVGAGLHITQTVGLALATDLVPIESHPKMVGLMYVMLLVGSIVSALVFGALLADYTHGRLVQVIQGSAVVTVVLNLVALWKQETRNPRRGRPYAPPAKFKMAWKGFIREAGTARRLAAVGIGSLAFSMMDILLEPYGGQLLGMTVGATTRLTATLATGSLLGFAIASYVLSRGEDPFRMANYGAVVGVPAFLLVMLAAPLGNIQMFTVGVSLIGFGAGLFGHGTLTATINLAPKAQVGLALGAWGAVQASAAGLGAALGGTLRDLVRISGAFSGAASSPEAPGYMAVFALEVVLLLWALAAMAPLLRGRETAAAR